MTIEQALHELLTLWPEGSFSIECDVWSHYHDSDGTRSIPSVEWSIYSVEHRQHYTSGTLEGALAFAKATVSAETVGLAAVKDADKSIAGGAA